MLFADSAEGICLQVGICAEIPKQPMNIIAAAAKNARPALRLMFEKSCARMASLSCNEIGVDSGRP